jgi:RNA polymerase sigma-70 factor (ECF subfamily)
LTPQEEAKLVKACAGGDPGAWRRFVDLYGPRVYGAIRYFLRSYRESLFPDEALNIYQEMFLDLCDNNYRKLKTFRAGGQLGTWLFTVARRQCLSHIRASTRKKRFRPAVADSEILEIGQPLTQGTDALTASENREAVLKAMDKLSYENRLLLVLFYFEDLSYEEIAKVVGVSANSVSAMLRKARKSIARILKE